MAEYLPKFQPGQGVTYTAAGPITGGDLVELGPTPRSVVRAAAASAKVVGVAAQDVATGDPVTVYSGGVQIGVAAAAIPLGSPVEAGANGQLRVATTAAIGLAVTAGAAALDRVEFRHYN